MNYLSRTLEWVKKKRGTAAASGDASGRAASSLDDAAVSPDSRSNQSESDTQRARDKVINMLRDTTDAQVHIASTVVSRVGLHTDYVLSTDSCDDNHKHRIKDYVSTQLTPEVFEVFEAEVYVPEKITGFPVDQHVWRSTLVVRAHAILTIYTPLRYWISRLTFSLQMLLLFLCVYIVVYMVGY